MTIVYRNGSTAAVSHNRIASWIRKDYPKEAPERGHNYLVAPAGWVIQPAEEAHVDEVVAGRR